MFRIVITLLSVVVIAGCDGPRQPQVSAAAGCAAPIAPWRSGDIDPPNRVMAFKVLAERQRLVVNGVKTEHSRLWSSLDAARTLRPSPYLILSYRGDLGCGDVDELTRAIDQHFNCHENYCFFAGRR